jgi:streptogramin lyase
MAFSPRGTLYFVDGNRVRAVSTSGVVRTVAGNGSPGSTGVDGPAVDASLSPSDVAVSPDGTLYIADGSSVMEVSPSGTISTFVTGGAPLGVDVSTPFGPVAFYPTNIAFDGAGNLDVFSFSPKEIFQISPAGKISLLGEGYTAQLTTAPNGDVIMANHGESVGRIKWATISQELDLLSLRIRGLRQPGDELGIEPNGIAVAPSGTIYVDSFSGNGWTGGTSVVEISPTGRARTLALRRPT